MILEFSFHMFLLYGAVHWGAYRKIGKGSIVFRTWQDSPDAICDFDKWDRSHFSAVKTFTSKACQITQIAYIKISLDVLPSNYSGLLPQFYSNVLFPSYYLSPGCGSMATCPRLASRCPPCSLHRFYWMPSRKCRDFTDWRLLELWTRLPLGMDVLLLTTREACKHWNWALILLRPA